MVEQGVDHTSEVTLDQMVYHTTMVAQGRVSVPIVADLSFSSYTTPEKAVLSAKRLIEAGADAVKFEGDPPGVADAILAEGIPVMAHLGLLPQTSQRFRVYGKDPSEALKLEAEAARLALAGCFAVVLECIPRALGKKITESLVIPTIGIGAGPETSGQVLVFHDLLGLSAGPHAKFVPTKYPPLGSMVTSTLRAWADDVRTSRYPSDDESYH